MSFEEKEKARVRVSYTRQSSEHGKEVEAASTQEGDAAGAQEGDKPGAQGGDAAGAQGGDAPTDEKSPTPKVTMHLGKSKTSPETKTAKL